MKRNTLFNIILLAGIAAGFVSCGDTWLKYDTSRKGKLYFSTGKGTDLDKYISTDVSFALLDESVKELPATVTVSLMGTIADYDRTFAVTAIHDTTSYFTSGGIHRELVDAKEGEDYTLGQLFIPAGAVKGEIEVTVKRTEKILTKTASLVLQIAETDLFEGVPRNVYRILISDGEPACPTWWRYDANNEWYMYLGIFTPGKYRKLLEFYHGIGDTNPSLYAKLVEQYGENIDKKQKNASTGELEDLRMGFMHSNSNPYKLAWVRYVLCPMFDYYSTNYPDAEVYTDKSVNVTTKGWRNPDYNY